MTSDKGDKDTPIVLRDNLPIMDIITWFRTTENSLSAKGLEAPYSIDDTRSKRRNAAAMSVIKEHMAPELKRAIEPIPLADELMTKLTNRFLDNMQKKAKDAASQLHKLKWPGNLDDLIQEVEDLAYIIRHGRNTVVPDEDKIDHVKSALPSAYLVPLSNQENLRQQLIKLP